MALVMLPCDLPWWGQVQKYLNKLSNTKNTLELIEGMHKIHEICNVSLDPDEEDADPQCFIGLLNFLDNEFSSEERSNFLNKTLPNIIRRALNLKEWKPRGGLHFSLQQQPDATEFEYNFISSLLANAFFSTFPKRTNKSHPTLQNFNFSEFFKYLESSSQKAKLRSILHYFDWLEDNEHSSGSLKIMRQIMSSKEWLTIEDWLECSLPLCTVSIKHEGKLDRADLNSLHVCFSSSKIGGRVLENGNSQECINLTTYPEILSVLLHVEALEDNEVLTIENVRNLSKIVDPKNKACFQKLESSSQKVTVCCMDAEDYTKLPISQYEEDNILRELNKCLLAFQQKQTQTNNEPQMYVSQQNLRSRRLSPIGESISSTPPEYTDKHNIQIPMITQDSCSTNKSGSRSSSLADNNNFLTDKLKIQIERENAIKKRAKGRYTTDENVLNSRRGRFIVLGSSGEHLPTRRPMEDKSNSSVTSSEDEFHSAKTSLDEVSSDEDFNRRYSVDLESPDSRLTFAQRLRDALRRETSNTSTSSEDNNYAVGISVTGSGVRDHNIKLRRGGSTGFMLHEESMDEDFLKDSLNKEKEWVDKFKSKQNALSKRDSAHSSDYSFSTEYSSELEEVYEQFSKWLKDPIIETEKGTKRELDSRDLAVVQFAGLLLKRTLSESFAGVSLTEGCDNTLSGNIENYGTNQRSKLVLSAKSLSLELARHKHKLAAQLSMQTEETLNPPLLDTETHLPEQKENRVKETKQWAASIVSTIVQTLEDICVNVSPPQLSQIAQKPDDGVKVVSTGNWGCGSTRAGEVQLKVIIQWLAASVAGVPTLVYYTVGHKELVKLDTVCRILIDRKWTVRDLAQATLRYSSQVLHGRESSGSLFEEIIGVDRTV